MYSNDIDVSDRVFLRNSSERGGTGKHRSHWEGIISIVTKSR